MTRRVDLVHDLLEALEASQVAAYKQRAAAIYHEGCKADPEVVTTMHYKRMARERAAAAAHDYLLRRRTLYDAFEALVNNVLCPGSGERQRPEKRQEGSPPPSPD